MACKKTVVALALPAAASAHAFITQPAMRGGASGNTANAFCPQCLGTTALPMPTCGTGTFLDWGTEWAEAPALVAGQMTEFKVKVTAHHMGHFVFRLCDRPIDSSLGGLDSEEECLNEHVLERVRPELVHSDCQLDDDRGDCQPMDDNHPGYWYLPPRAEDTGRGAGTYSFHYWVPANLTCEKCTLQWWWMSANSCTPHPDAYRQYFQKMERLGWDAGSWCSGGNGACCFKESDNCRPGGRLDCGEQFKNCADVRVVSGDGSAPSPNPPATPTTAPPTSAPSPTQAPSSPTQAPSSSTQAPAGSACVRNPSCEGNQWCEQVAVYEKWCPDHSADSCPSPQCRVAAAGSTVSLSASPTTTTTTPTTTTTTSTSMSTSSSSSLSSTSSSSSLSSSSTSTTSASTTTKARSTTMSKGVVGGLTCVAAPGLNRGVSDSDCSRCETGYEFWPCNEDILCECSERVAALSVSRRLVRRSGQGFLAPDHAMLQVSLARTEL